MTPLSEVLLVHRARARLDQKAVAEALGVSQQMVSKWERGLSKPASVHHEKLAAMLGIAREELAQLASEASPRSQAAVEEVEAMRRDIEALRAAESARSEAVESMQAQIAHLHELIELLAAGGDDELAADDPRRD